MFTSVMRRARVTGVRHTCTTNLLYHWPRRAVPHKLVMTRQVRDWLHALRSGDPVTRRLVAEAIDRLLDDGPALGRPLACPIAGSRPDKLNGQRPAPTGTDEE